MHLSGIPEGQRTLWEREYSRKRPYHFYKIRSEWPPTERDFMAYWNGRKQDLLDELGHPSARPIVAINRWMDPIVRDGVDTKNATTRQWTEYDEATLEAYGKLSWHDMEALKGSGIDYHDKYRSAWSDAWEALSQDEQDAVRGMTDEQKADREAFESMTPEERAEHERAVRASGGGRKSTRNHVDGRILDERGRTVGWWKEPEGSLLDKVKAWAANAVHGEAHVRRWQEAANGIEPGTFPGVATMTAAQAAENATRFMRSRWAPVARAIRDREIGFTGEAQGAEAQLEDALTILNERPDVEVRKYNPETNTLDVLSPADAAYKAEQDAYAEEVTRFQEARDAGDPEAQDGFDHWLLRDSPEREAAREQVAQQKALREAIPGDNAALAARTQEILAKAAKDQPTPADIEAAVAAGDWHKLAELAKAQAKAQVPPPGYVWFGWIRQGSIPSGQYICIGDGEYEEAILYLASDFGGREPKPRLYQQNALNGPCRVRHSHDWNDCLREGPFLKTWAEIRAEYGNI